ncbi:flippase [Neptuniibacter sp. QD57_21]|uniref:flippase n=1 Tax=Neptuniibacter sp. QD57_21 TaxID=3398213 RepID=UPI0039F5598B
MVFFPKSILEKIRNRPSLAKIANNIVWLFFDKLLRLGGGLVVGVWIARYLGPEQFGLLNFVTAFVGLFVAFAGLGLKGVVIRDLVNKPDSSFEILGTALMLKVAGGVAAYVLVAIMMFWLRPDDVFTQTITLIIGSTLIFKVGEIVTYWFESQVLSKYVVWVQNGCFLAASVIKVVLILNEAPLKAFVWVIASEALFVAVLLIWVFAIRAGRLQRLRFTFQRAKSLLSDSWPLMLSGISMTVYMNIDQVMLGQLANDEAVGVYSAAAKVSQVWYFIPMIIVSSVFPAILKAKMRDETQYYQRLQRLFDLMAWLSFMVAVPLTLVATPLMVIVFGDLYEQSGAVLAIHVWASVFVFMGVAGGKWFLAENRQILNFYRKALGAIANIGLNLILIPLYGPIGAAIATIISYAIVEFIYDVFQRETRCLFIMKLQSLNLYASAQRLICKI